MCFYLKGCFFVWSLFRTTIIYCSVKTVWLKSLNRVISVAELSDVHLVLLQKVVNLTRYFFTEWSR